MTFAWNSWGSSWLGVVPRMVEQDQVEELGPCLIKAVGSSGDSEQAEAMVFTDECEWGTWREVEPVGTISRRWLSGSRPWRRPLDTEDQNGNHDEEIQVGRHLERRNQSL